VWICYRSFTSAISSPTCAAAGTATTITAAGSGTQLVCTATASTGDPVSLTWSESTQTYIRARACTASSDTAQADNPNVLLSHILSITITPTSLAQGGTLSAAYTGWASGAVWICYRSGLAAVSTLPSCAAAGSATTVTGTGSGAATVCTASASTGSAVSLTWTESTQAHIRARACTTSSDTAQVDNADVTLAESIAVTFAPTTLPEGSTVAATYSGWVSGAVWICYRSGTSAVVAPACGPASTATTVSAAGSGSGPVCTASASTGAAVSFVWAEWTQTYIRARACKVDGDAKQVAPPEVTLTAQATCNDKNAAALPSPNAVTDTDCSTQSTGYIYNTSNAAGLCLGSTCDLSLASDMATCCMPNGTFCSPTLQMNEAGPITVTKSARVVLTSTAGNANSYRCTTTYLWSISPVVPAFTLSLTDPSLSILPGKLAVGSSYTVTIKTANGNSYGQSNDRTASLQVNVVPGALSVSVAEGSRMIFQIGRPLLLNAAVADEDGAQLIVYHWTSSQINLGSYAPSVTSQAIHINTTLLPAGTYVFQVNITRMENGINTTASGQSILELSQSPVPTVVISKYYNEAQFPSTKQLSLLATAALSTGASCTACTFVWSMHPTPQPGGDLQSIQASAESGSSGGGSNMSSSASASAQSNIVIKSDSLAPGTTVEFTCSVTVGSTVGFSTISIPVNGPPSGGQVQASISSAATSSSSPLTGTCAGGDPTTQPATRFYITASNFVDEDLSNNLHLSYRFGFLRKGSAGYPSSTSWLTQFTTSPRWDTAYLPKGTVKIAVEARDSAGASSVVHGAQELVLSLPTPPSGKTEKQMVADNVAAILANVAGGAAKATAVVGLLSTVDPGSISNTSSSEALAVKGAITTMAAQLNTALNNGASDDVVIEGTSLLLANIDLVSTQAKDSALNMMDSVTQLKIGLCGMPFPQADMVLSAFTRLSAIIGTAQSASSDSNRVQSGIRNLGRGLICAVEPGGLLLNLNSQNGAGALRRKNAVTTKQLTIQKYFKKDVFTAATGGCALKSFGNASGDTSVVSVVVAHQEPMPYPTTTVAPADAAKMVSPQSVRMISFTVIDSTGQVMNLQNMAPPATMIFNTSGLPTTGVAGCAWYDATNVRFSSSGTTTSPGSSSHLVCNSNHLTDFVLTTKPSSSSCPTSATTSAYNTRIVQQITFRNINSTSYLQGSPTQIVYHGAYGHLLSTYDISSGCDLQGSSVSTIVGGRRTAVITFTASVAPALSTSAIAAAQSLGTNTFFGSPAAAQIAAAIDSVRAARGYSATDVFVPTKHQIAFGVAIVTPIVTPIVTRASGSSSKTGLIIGLVIGLVAACLCCLAIAAVRMWRTTKEKEDYGSDKKKEFENWKDSVQYDSATSNTVDNIWGGPIFAGCSEAAMDASEVYAGGADHHTPTPRQMEPPAAAPGTCSSIQDAPVNRRACQAC